MKLTGQIKEKSLRAFQKKGPLFRGRPRPRIWVIIADTHIVKVFRKTDGHVEMIGQATPEVFVEAEFSNKVMGRMVSYAGSTLHHKFEPHMEESREQDISFIRQFSQWLEYAETLSAFDRLVLVAEPQTLGYLRSYMPKAVDKLIVAEINKNLTKLNPKDLRKALDDILWF